MKKFKLRKPQTGTFWLDETGLKIPTNRLTSLEKKMERNATKLTNDAIKLHESLKSYKNTITEVSDTIYRDFLKEKDLDGLNRKGNFVWYNFDRSIKIEININDVITFDDMKIMAAREKLDTFIEENVEGKVDFIKELVNDAFKTSRGRLDTKKVLSLIRYRSKIKDALFQDALTLIEDSIRRPSKRTYYRVSVKDETGKYQNIELNFSNI